MPKFPNKFPLFSVLMANHNREIYITEAIKSILNQTYTNFELLICDDYSSDHSVTIIEQFIKKDARIKLFINHENKGVGFTKNFLAEKAQGEMSGFFDSDDFLAHDALQKMVSLHQKLPQIVTVYSNHFICDENLTILKKGSSRKIPSQENHLTYFGISHFATYKTASYCKTVGIDKHLNKAVDQDLYYKLEEQGDSYFLDECLYYYRHNSASISLNKEQSKANNIKVEVMQKAIERRKNTNTKFPSAAYFEFINYKSQTGKGIFSYFFLNPFKHFGILLYFCFSVIKNKTILFLS